jgi:hypothetical protein
LAARAAAAGAVFGRRAPRLGGRGAATPIDPLAHALWVEAATADHHARAAIRTHVRKLAAAGLAGALTTLALIGYRIDLEG